MQKLKQKNNPLQFSLFYHPLIIMKQKLLSKKDVFENGEHLIILKGLMLTYYSTFIIRDLYRRTIKPANANILIIREMIEYMLESDEFNLTKDHISKLCNYVDLVVKLLNMISPDYIYIAMYNGHLDFEIYYNLHQDLRIFDFKYYCTVNKDVVEGMKQHNAAAENNLLKIQKKKNKC